MSIIFTKIRYVWKNFCNFVGIRLGISISKSKNITL